MSQQSMQIEFLLHELNPAASGILILDSTRDGRVSLPASSTLADGYNGYLPTPEQHELDGYKTWPARSSYFEVHAEAKIRATMLELLKQAVTE